MLPPPGAQLGIIDPKGNGLAALMVRYELTKNSTTGKAPSVLASYDFTDRDKSLKDFMAGMRASHAWVFQTSKKVRLALGVDLPGRASHLLEKKMAPGNSSNSGLTAAGTILTVCWTEGPCAFALRGGVVRPCYAPRGKLGFAPVSQHPFERFPDNV
jgi:hypothetical protein